jgi:plasmid stability protein
MASLYVRDVPDGLLKAARIEAIKADQTLREFMLEAIATELKTRGVQWKP